jgi:hypothetical protein
MFLNIKGWSLAFVFSIGMLCDVLRDNVGAARLGQKPW